MTKSCKAGAFKECVLSSSSAVPKHSVTATNGKLGKETCAIAGGCVLSKKKIYMGTYVFAVTRYRIRPTTVQTCNHDHGRISSSPCPLELGQRSVLRQARKSMTGSTKTCATRLATEEVPNSIDCLFVRRWQFHFDQGVEVYAN